MKRLNKLFPEVVSIENLILADQKAQKGKSRQYGVRIYNKNKEENILHLHDMLISKTYKTSEYDIFKVFESKEREVYRLPYFPDRITHHAIMNVLEPIFVSTFTADSYSCIKGRGIHKASFAVRKSLKNKAETTYCLKLDVKKFIQALTMIYLKCYSDENLKTMICFGF